MDVKQHYKHKHKDEQERESRQPSVESKNWDKGNEARKREGHGKHPVCKWCL